MNIIKKCTAKVTFYANGYITICKDKKFMKAAPFEMDMNFIEYYTKHANMHN